MASMLKRRGLTLLACVLILFGALSFGVGTPAAQASTISIEYGESTNLSATFRYPTTTNVVWTTSDASVCVAVKKIGSSYSSSNGVYITYSESYQIAATGVGTCTVTATCGKSKATATVEVTKAKVAIPTASSFEYDGSSHNGVKASSYYSVANGTATNAGEYTAVLSLKNTANCSWEDGTTSDKTLKWKISKATVRIPAAAKLTYTGSEQVAVDETCGYNTDSLGKEKLYTVSGQYKATSAGTYKAVASLADKANYVWSDGTNADKQIAWSIEKIKLGLPIACSGLAYTGKSISAVDWSALEEALKSDADLADFYLSSAEVASSSAWVSANALHATYLVSSSVTRDELVAAYEEAAKADEELASARSARDAAVYARDNYAQLISVSGSSAVEAGKHVMSVELVAPEDLCWTDGTTEKKEITWSIGKAKKNPFTCSLKKATLKVNTAKAQTTTVVLKNAKGKVTYASSSKNVTVSKSGKVTVKKGFKGTAKITVVDSGGTNYPQMKKVLTLKVK